MAFDAEQTTKSHDLIVLEKARERIARGWWSPHNGCESDDPACTMNAIFLETEGEPDRCKRLQTLIGFPELHLGWAWNDAPGRTQAQVLARFDAAIAKLAAEQ